MRIGGKTVTAPKDKLLVIPRDDGPIVFLARAVEDFDEQFDAICPLPKPPGQLTKDGWVSDIKDPTYQTVLAQRSSKRFAYLAILSLAPSNIEWDTVELNNPKTWTNWDVDLKKAGLIQNEVNHVLELVIEANVLSEEKIRAARESFLRGQETASAASLGQHSEPVSTPSGPVAPVSE